MLLSLHIIYKEYIVIKFQFLERILYLNSQFLTLRLDSSKSLVDQPNVSHFLVRTSSRDATW